VTDMRNLPIVPARRIVTVPFGARIAVGAGWDVGASKRVDVDLSVVLYDASGLRELDMVNFHKRSGQGLRHMGDNRTGAGSGDDEVVYIDLAAIPSSTEHIFILLNVFSPPGSTFLDVPNLGCRLYYQSSYNYQIHQQHHGITEFEIPQHQARTGLILAQLVRHDNHWVVNPLDIYVDGNTCDQENIRRALIEARGSAKRRRTA